ncbi:hypothetical protein C8R48DRAFT_768708 [Suillus tomentosus]|nr:hypothetical protein C8R48DRAFT_768708 [Suillus tomentosus]
MAASFESPSYQLSVIFQLQNKLQAFSGIGSKFFCSYCLLPLHDIDNVDQSQWPSHDVETHCKHASAYRDAAMLEERQRLFDQFGVRWTELLRLPYWDPISFTVVESMHILYLRILRYHCWVAWRMNVDLEDGETTSGEGTKSFARLSDKDMQNGVDALATGTFGALEMCTKPVLYHLCQDRDLRRASTKRALIKTLLNWKTKQATGDILSKPFIPPRPSKKSPKTDAESAMLLMESTDTVSDVSLLRFMKPILASLCDAKCECHSGNKSDLIGRLLDWHSSKNLLIARTALESASGSGTAIRNNQRTAEEYISLSLKVNPDTLMTYTRIVLVALCSEQHLSIIGQKKVPVQCLIRWRGEQQQLSSEQNQHDHNVHQTPTDLENSHDPPRTEHSGPTRDHQPHCVVLGQSLVTEIQRDMARTELPTWVSRAPKALSSTAQGKLSADQWCAACTINMTITPLYDSGVRAPLEKVDLN